MKIKKRLLSLILIVCVLCGSLVPSFFVSAAPAVSTVAQLAGYVISAVGLVDMLGNGSVRKSSGSVLDTIKQKISDNIGTGVYVDSNGNYVFTDSFQNDLFEAMTSDSSIDARTISNFGGSTQNGLYFSGSPYVSSEMKSLITSWNLDYDNVYITLSVFRISNTDYISKLVVYDISDVAFAVVKSDTSYGYSRINLMNSSGNYASCPFHYAYQTYNTSSGFGTLNQNTNGSYESRFFWRNKYDYASDRLAIAVDMNLFMSENDYNFSNTQDNTFLKFPFIGSNGLSMCWSDRSMILAKSVADAQALNDFSVGNYITNYYIPSVPQEVVFNNDWDSIYTQFVTNTNNNTYEGITNDELKQLLYDSLQPISAGINAASTNIVDSVTYTYEWLKKIHDLLYEIKNKLNTFDGGGSGVSNDYTQALQRIENYCSSIAGDTSSMLQIETYLSQLVSNSDDMVEYLRKIASGTGSPSIPEGWDILPDMPDQDILDTISNFEVIQLALKNVVPFCFISVIGEFFAVFAVSPQAPRFEIPVSFHNSFVDIDESIIIDLSFFDPIQPIIIVFWYAVFVVCLAYLTFKLFWFWTVFFYS